MFGSASHWRIILHLQPQLFYPNSPGAEKHPSHHDAGTTINYIVNDVVMSGVWFNEQHIF